MKNEQSNQTPVENSTSAGNQTPVENSTSAGSQTPVENSTSVGSQTPVENSTSVGSQTPVENSTSVGSQVSSNSSSSSSSSAENNSENSTSNATVLPANMDSKELKRKRKLVALAKKQRKSFREFFLDFKKFISKGNILNLAVAVVIGTAFTNIVNSLVGDLIMPLITLMTGKNSLELLSWQIGTDIYIYWGKFLQTILNFFIIAFFLFVILRVILNTEQGITKLTKKQKKLLKQDPDAAAKELPPPAPIQKIESTEDILKDIRSLLSQQSLPKIDSEPQKADSDK